MLLLGTGLIGTSFDARYRAASEAAGRKISAVLPESLRSDVEMLRESIHFLPGRPDPAAESLAKLRRAIMGRSTVRFVYHTRSRAKGAERIPLCVPEIDSRPLEARALFRSEVMRWVRENPSFYMVAEDEMPEGLLVTLRLRQESDILPWLLGWGRNVRVQAPESLRGLIAEEARALLIAHEPHPLNDSFPSRAES